MVAAEITAQNDAWSRVHELRYRQLLTALDWGWQIEESVYLRPRFGDIGARVYHFILRCGVNVPLQLIVVPECPEVVALVKRESLKVQTK